MTLDKGSLHWSKAQQKAKELKREEQQRAKQYQEQVDIANEEIWQALSQEDFNFSDFEDICYHNGIDQDDLIDRLI